MYFFNGSTFTDSTWIIFYTLHSAVTFLWSQTKPGIPRGWDVGASPSYSSSFLMSWCQNKGTSSHPSSPKINDTEFVSAKPYVVEIHRWSMITDKFRSTFCTIIFWYLGSPFWWKICIFLIKSELILTHMRYH